MPTILDVAQKAGVSVSTVSRVVNGHDVVAASTRERVLSAIRELGFEPNHFAQGLRLGRTRTLALVVGDIAQYVYLQIAKHLQSRLEEENYHLLLFDLGHSEDRLQAIFSRISSLRLCGVILATPERVDFDALRRFRQGDGNADCPIIVVGQDRSPEGVPSVLHDDFGAAYGAARHLWEAGHRRIGYVGRIEGSAVGRARYSGYEAAIAELSGRNVPSYVWDCSFRYPAAYAAVGDAFKSGATPDAIVAGSDEMALGAMAAALDSGLRVPADLSIIGFGDIDWTPYVRPSLATLSTDFEFIAASVVRVLLAVEKGETPPLVSCSERKLLLRESVQARDPRRKSKPTRSARGGIG